MPKATRCFLGSRTLDIDEALAIPEIQVRRKFRCIECGERVRAHKEGTTQQAAHFEHLSANPRCSLSGSWRGDA